MHKPSFQFYTGDWLKDPGVRRLSPREKGVYIELLILMFDSGGYTQKMTETELMQALNFRAEDGEETKGKVDSIFHKVMERLKECKVIYQTEDGRLYNKRILRDMEEKEEISKKRSEAGKIGNQKRWGENRKCDTVCDDFAIANESHGATEKNRLSTSTSISLNTLSNAPARECEDDPDGIIVPKNMPVSPQNAVDMCLGAGIPDDFVIKAYNEAYAVGFKDRGNPIMSWKQYVTNYWNAHRNAQERRRKSYTPERPTDQYPNDRAEIPSL